MDEKIKRICIWLNGGRAPPFMLNIIPTNNCNLACLSCKARGKPKFVPGEENISNEQYTSLINDASKLGVKRIEISGGGEPLCRRETTFSIMKTIKKCNIEGFLVTNGTLFTESMIKELVRIEWDSILFSIDAPDAKTNDYLRGKKGAFQKSTKAIKLFTYWKKKLKKEKPKLHLGPVLSSINYNKINGLIELVHNFCMESIVLQPIEILGNRGGEMLKLNEKQKKSYRYNLKNAVKFAAKYNIYANLNNIDEGTSKEEIDRSIKKVFKVSGNKFLKIPCHNPFYFMLIDVDSKVYPCPTCAALIYENNLDSGNIKNTNLENIWYGRYFDIFRKNLINKNLSQTCKKCCGLFKIFDEKICFES